MPRVPRLERLFVKPNKTWSPFPLKPLPFRIVEWESKKHRGNCRVQKVRPPSQIPSITPLYDKEWPIIRGDLVQIMNGRDTGKQGKVRAVARKKNQLKVQGLNCSEQFIDDMGDGNSGYLLNEEPIRYFDVKLVDPFTGKPVDVVMRYNDEGKRVRVCTDSGRVIPKPLPERTDWKTRSAVKEGDSDTKADIVQQYSYVPSLLLFHEEIMKDMNIPMSVPKTTLERRDLIFKEIEEEAVQERRDGQSQVVENDSSIVGQLKSIGQNMMFWRR